MNIVRDVQWKWLLPIWLPKSTIWLRAVSSDRRIKVREVVKARAISQGTVFSILNEKLGVNKISARWVPRLLSVENKHDRVMDSKAIFPLYHRNPDKFLRRYITMDETWIPLHSRNKGTVKTVGFWRRSGFEKVEDGEIDRQGDGHGFLGCTRNHLHRLLGKRTKDNWSVLCVVIAPVEQRNQKKTSSFEKGKDSLLSRQYTGAHLRSYDGQN